MPRNTRAAARAEEEIDIATDPQDLSLLQENQNTTDAPHMSAVAAKGVAALTMKKVERPPLQEVELNTAEPEAAVDADKEANPEAKKVKGKKKKGTKKVTKGKKKDAEAEGDQTAQVGQDLPTAPGPEVAEDDQTVQSPAASDAASEELNQKNTPGMCCVSSSKNHFLFSV